VDSWLVAAGGLKGAMRHTLLNAEGRGDLRHRGPELWNSCGTAYGLGLPKPCGVCLGPYEGDVCILRFHAA